MSRPGIGLWMQTMMNVEGLEPPRGWLAAEGCAEMQEDGGIEPTAIRHPVDRGTRMTGEELFDVFG